MRSVLEGLGGVDGLRGYAARHGIDLSAYEQAFGAYPNLSDATRGAMLADELLAQLSERGPPGIAGKVRAAIGAIRAWLRDHGFPGLAKLGDTDIAHILARARRAAIRNLLGVTDDGPPVFSRAPGSGPRRSAPTGPAGPVPAMPNAIPASMTENVVQGRAAVERLLQSSDPNGIEWHAMYRDGIGWISFVKDTDGLGFEHIIDSRTDPAKQGMSQADAEAFIRSIPDMVAKGRAGRWHVYDGRVSRTIFSPRGTLVLSFMIPLQGGAERATWVVTAFPESREMPMLAQPISEAEANRRIGAEIRTRNMLRK